MGLQASGGDAAGIVHAIDHTLLIVFTAVDLDSGSKCIELLINPNNLPCLNPQSLYKLLLAQLDPRLNPDIPRDGHSKLFNHDLLLLQEMDELFRQGLQVELVLLALFVLLLEQHGVDFGG